MPDMVTEFIGDLVPLMVGGVPIAVFVFLAVQALAAVGLLPNSLAKRRAVLLVATIFAAVWTFRVLAEAPAISAVLVIDTAVVALTGALVAAAIYTGWESLRDRLKPAEPRAAP